MIYVPLFVLQAREQKKQAQDRESALSMEALMGKTKWSLDKQDNTRRHRSRAVS